MEQQDFDSPPPILAKDAEIGGEYKTLTGILVVVKGKGSDRVMLSSSATGHDVEVSADYPLYPLDDEPPSAEGKKDGKRIPSERETRECLGNPEKDNPAQRRQKILGLLTDQELDAKVIAEKAGIPLKTTYRLLRGLEKEGWLVKKRLWVEAKNTWVWFYSAKGEAREDCEYEPEYPDITSEFFEEIERLGETDRTLNLLITGDIGMGKSLTAIHIARHLSRVWGISFHLSDIIFRSQELIEIVRQQPRDRILILDDVGVVLDARSWGRQRWREQFFHALETWRTRNINSIFTVQSLGLVDVNTRRLVPLVLRIAYQCSDHLHAILSRKVEVGNRVEYDPIGEVNVPYPKEEEGFYKAYLQRRDTELSRAITDQDFESLKAKVLEAAQAWGTALGAITSQKLNALLVQVGETDFPLTPEQRAQLEAELGLRSLKVKREAREKGEAEKRLLKERVRITKERQRAEKLKKSYKNKRQGYIDEGWSGTLAEALAEKVVYGGYRVGPLHQVLRSLKGKIERGLLERYVLNNLGNDYLVANLRSLREFLGAFPNFDMYFYTQLFSLLMDRPKEGVAFMEEAQQQRAWYKKGSKLDTAGWRRAVAGRLETIRAKHAYQASLQSIAKTIGGFGNPVAKLAGWAGVYYLIRKFSPPR